MGRVGQFPSLFHLILVQMRAGKVFVITLILIYLFFSFGALEKDPRCWEQGVRWGAVAMSCLMLYVCVTAHFLNSKPQTL